MVFSQGWLTGNENYGQTGLTFVLLLVTTAFGSGKGSSSGGLMSSGGGGRGSSETSSYKNENRIKSNLYT